MWKTCLQSGREEEEVEVGGRERERRRGGGRRETVGEMTTSVCVCVFIENEEVGSRNGGLGRQKK